MLLPRGASHTAGLHLVGAPAPGSQPVGLNQPPGLHLYGSEADVVSAHRMPEDMVRYGREAHSRGLEVIIAGAGVAAHLPGMLASLTPLPVIGVPVPLKYLDGMDSLLSIVQMPAGVPVATLAIGPAGATNAALLAVSILAASRPELRASLHAFRAEQAQRVSEAQLP